MKKFILTFFVLLFVNFSYGIELDFNKEGNIDSNKILTDFILEEIPNVDFNVISYFCDLDNDGDDEILGIIKSNLFYNLKGYKLFILRKKDDTWVAIHSDINFDNSKPIIIEDNKITYFGGALYDGKKYKALYKKNEIKTNDKIFDFRKNKKIGAIEEVTYFEQGGPKNKIDLADFNSPKPKRVKIYYKNLSEKTKHYLDMQ